MAQGVLSDIGELAGELTPVDSLSGELAAVGGLEGELTIPTVVNGLNHETFLLHDWDFSAGLTDRVQGSAAILGNSAIQEEDGILFRTHKDYILLDITYEYNRTYVIDFGEMWRRANGDQHGRIFMPTTDMGVMYRMDGEWLIWGQTRDGRGKWSDHTGLTDPDVFSYKSMKIYVAPDGAISVYLDNELFMSTDLIIPKQGSITIGSVNWQSFFLMTVRAFREYYGFYEQ